MEEEGLCCGPHGDWDDVEAHTRMRERNKEPHRQPHQQEGDKLCRVVRQEVGERSAATEHGDGVVAGFFAVDDVVLPLEEVEQHGHKKINIDHRDYHSIYHRRNHTINGQWVVRKRQIQPVVFRQSTSYLLHRKRPKSGGRPN